MEAKSKGVDRTLQKKRVELMAAQERLQAFKDELEIVKSELGTGHQSESMCMISYFYTHICA